MRRICRLVTKEITSVLVPVFCPGCLQPDIRICPDCSKSFRSLTSQDLRQFPRLAGVSGLPPVLAITRYQGPVKETVLAWKDRSRADLTMDISGGFEDILSWLWFQHPESGQKFHQRLLRSGVAIYYPPSSASSRRVRGREPVRELAKHLKRSLLRAGVPAQVCQPLTSGKKKRDQVGLSSAERWQNQENSLHLKASVMIQRSKRIKQLSKAGAEKPLVILLDDLITTGATVRRMIDFLQQIAVTVELVIALAVTPPPAELLPTD